MQSAALQRSEEDSSDTSPVSQHEEEQEELEPEQAAESTTPLFLQASADGSGGGDDTEEETAAEVPDAASDIQKAEDDQEAGEATDDNETADSDLQRETEGEQSEEIFEENKEESETGDEASEAPDAVSETDSELQREPEEQTEAAATETDGAFEETETPDQETDEVAADSEAANATPESDNDLQRQPEEEQETARQESPADDSLQAKLTVGAPDDEHEQEADHVADRVMRTPADRIAQPFDKDEEQQPATDRVQAKNRTPPYLQRVCSACEREKNKPAAAGASQTGSVQAKANAGKTQGAAAFPGSMIKSPAGGSSLPAYVRSRVEPVLGADLGHVKVHSDARANQAAHSIHARAFTHKHHIFLGKDQSAHDLRLMAHESTHTVQQGATRVSKSGADTIRRTRRPVIQRGLWSATGGKVVSYVGGKAKAAYRWGKKKIIGIIEKYVPGLLKLLRGGLFGVIRDKVLAGINTLTGGLLSTISKKGLSGALKSGVGDLLGEMGKAAANLTRGGCDAVLEFAGSLLKFARFIASPAIRLVKSVIGAIGKFFGTIWNDFAKPALEAIASVAGAAWTWIKEKAQWIWDKLKPVRETISRAWNWLKKKFGIAWGAAGDVLGWFKKKAKAVWDWVYSFIKPVLGPLKVVAMVVGGVLFGPIILLVKGVPLLWKGLKWVWKNWGRKVLVKMRHVLHKKILPGLKSALQWLRAKINSAIALVSEKIATILEAFDSLLKALSKSKIFRVFHSAANFVARFVRRVAGWLRKDVIPFIKSGGDAVGKALDYLRPVMVLVAALVLFPVMPWMLPVVVAGWAWRILPECFKGPIINFVIGVMIFAFRKLPDFANFGDAWPNAKAKIISTLEEVRAMDLARKVEISNRIAKMMTGEDISWVSNVIRGVGNLIESARNMPDYFWGQAQEEVIGMNLSEPLPIERSKPRSPGGPGESRPPSDADMKLLMKEKLADGDIVMDPVLTLDSIPAFLEGENLEDGYEKEFGETTDESRSVAALQGEVAANMAASDETAGDVTAADKDAADTVPFKTPEEELQELMQQKPEGGCTKEKDKEPAKNTEVPEHMKKGPFTPGQRGRYLWHQMKQGVKQWFDCNWKWLLAASIAALIAFIAIAIITGGAALQALPLIMQIVGAIMIGVAIVRVAAYVKKYVTEGWVGNIAEGAKALARGLAIGAIELIFALLFNLGAVIKALKGGIKGAAKAAAGAAKATVKTTIKNVRKLGKVGAKAVSNTIKNGKIVMKGIKSGVIKGAKSLDDLGRRLAKRLRFKKFKIIIKNRRLKILGYINPWVEVVDSQIKVLKKKTKRSKFKTKAEIEAIRDASKPKTGKLKKFEAVEYRVSKASGKGARGKVGDKLTGDHIPSKAALVAKKEAQLKRKLTTKEAADLNNEGITVVLEGTTHAKLSRTYGGRNTAKQIAEDAGDLGKAFGKDVEAIFEGLKANNKLTNEVIGAYLDAYRKNVAKGIFKYSSDIDDIFMKFLKDTT